MSNAYHAQTAPPFGATHRAAAPAHASASALPATALGASALPVLSDSSDDDDDLPLPGSTSSRAASVLQKYLSGGGGSQSIPPQAAVPTEVAPARPALPAAAAATLPNEASLPYRQPSSRPAAPPRRPSAAVGYSSGSDHSQDGRAPAVATAVAPAGGASHTAEQEMDMSPILGQDKAAEAMDAKALAKVPAQVTSQAAAPRCTCERARHCTLTTV